MVEVESGQRHGIRSSPDFHQLAAGLPEKGNGVAYVGKRLQKTLGDLRIEIQPDPGKRKSAAGSDVGQILRIDCRCGNLPGFGATEDGWFTTGKTRKDLNEILGEVFTLPAYYLAVAAVEEIKQARGNNKLTKIKQNLANLRAAKGGSGRRKEPCKMVRC